MVFGMIHLHNNDDIRPRRNHLKVKKPWEVSTGHKEYRETRFDNRPKRLRTRKTIDKQWRDEYNM